MQEKTREKIVLVGGGHGTATLIESLKTMSSDITAVVTVSDGGGSSQILRITRGGPAVGDVRNVISALIPKEESDLKSLINFRFSSKKGSFLNRHALGNFVLVAALEMCKGDLDCAIRMTMKLFRAGHMVFPVTTDSVILCARLNDGSVIEGEGKIDKRSLDDHRHIMEVFLTPCATISPSAYGAILGADKIILCAGSFWTSLVPNLVVRGFREALQKTKAKLVYVVNIMTNHNETRGWTSTEHVRQVYRHIGRMIDVVIVNNGELSEDAFLAYLKEESEPVDIGPVDLKEMPRYAHEIIVDDFIHERPRYAVRHNRRLAEVIHSL